MLKKMHLILLVVLMLFIVSGCSNKKSNASKKIVLNYWRPWDETDDFKDIINAYQEKHPNVQIKYRKIRFEDFNNELINAMAEDRGPDIFSIQNAKVKEFQNKILPMPSFVKVTTLVVKKTPIKTEKYLETKKDKMLSIGDLKNKFVDVVADDVILQDKQGKDKIYGLPLFVDTLAMYYNKDLFNNAGIVEVPKYWDRNFQETVKDLTKQDTKGNIIQSGVALGTANNIERASDILSVLMMQNGTVIMDDSGNVLIDKVPAGISNYHPGIGALRFYTDFANPMKEVYCWNSNLDNSLKRFAEGNTAIMFGYSYHRPIIRAMSPKLNFNVAPLPQIKGNSINMANYYVETVSKKSAHSDEAWDFVKFMTTNENQVVKYLDKTKKPTALRSLIQDQLDDDNMKVFASQLLTAKSWYEGNNYDGAEKIMKQLIEEADKTENQADLNKVLKFAKNRLVLNNK